MPGFLYRRLRTRTQPHHGPGLTRREMIARTLAGSAGLLLSDRFVRAASSQARSTAPRALIVGGGFAGLAAAVELHAAGYDVHVFEARRRLGGRVVSFRDFAPGATVEGGGELIGANHPAWLSYARRFDLGFIDVPDDDGDAPVVLDGRALSAHEADALWHEIDGAYAALNALAAPVDANAPWRSPGAEALDRATVGEWLARARLSPLARRALDAEFAADNGVETAWQSQLGNLAQIKGGGLERYWTDSEVFRCNGGNQQLANKLASALPAGAVRHDAAVSAIVTTDRLARVTLRDGTSIEGDAVVLAVPPSVWPRIAIDPPLPAALRPQMGTNVKYLALVRSRFWTRANITAEWLSDGPPQLTWEATANQPGEMAVLTSFAGGEAAETCRGWRPAERANRYLRRLEIAYREIARAFVKGRFMDWPSDAWTRASYSFPAPGEVTTVGPLLAAGQGRLHFAGEHVCPAFVGYMEGALESGIAVAKRVAAADGLVRPDAA
jgi:monoamine oxidase